MYGYVRVSDNSQNERRQVDALLALGILPAHIYVDKQSGKNFDRPAWQALVKKLQPGDVLAVGSIDRMGRNYADILAWWRILTKEKEVDMVVLDMPLLDTRRNRDLLGTLIADMVISLFSYVAEKERVDIRTRQRAGIKAAKARGVHLGRPAIAAPDNFADVVARWEADKLTFEEALEQTGLKPATFYNRLRELRATKV